MGKKRDPSPVVSISAWIQRQSKPVKVALGLGLAIVVVCLMALQYTSGSHHNSFIYAGATRVAGICILGYKLHSKKSCAGLSLKSQELTAIYLFVRLICTLTFQLGARSWWDFSTLCSTLWVIYMMRFKLKSTYNKDLDTMPLYYVVVPAAILALLIHPFYGGTFFSITMMSWSFCVYMEAVAVLPQLRLMQNAKMAEPFTAHYVFALGIARFLDFAYWIIMIIETRGRFLNFWGYGSLWMLANLSAEIVQTFILSDFVYYYVKRVLAGELLVLPLPV